MRALLLAIVAVAGFGCGDHAATTRGFDPIRLIGDPGIDRTKPPFLTWGAVVAVDNVPRPVLSASTPLAPPSEVRTKDDGTRTVRATIPAETKAVPWVVFETVTTHAGKSKTMRYWPVTATMAGVAYEVGLVDNVVKDGVPSIRVWPVPDLATRDVETGPITVPPHAVLEVGVALEQISWDTTIMPVDMTVAAVVDGTPRTLHTERIEVRKKEYQRWVDLQVPLDALAGTSVRFRFTARPSMGPTAVVSLPVWADPTIVPATPKPAS